MLYSALAASSVGAVCGYCLRSDLSTKMMVVSDCGEGAANQLGMTVVSDCEGPANQLGADRDQVHGFRIVICVDCAEEKIYSPSSGLWGFGSLGLCPMDGTFSLEVFGVNSPWVTGVAMCLVETDEELIYQLPAAMVWTRDICPDSCNIYPNHGIWRS